MIMKEFVKPIAVLTVICLVVSAALAGTYDLTKPIIDAAKAAQADAAKLVVLPGANGFTQIDVTGIENVTEAFKENNGLGYVITSTSKGFDGTVTVMTGIGADGKVTGVAVLSHTETPTIGGAKVLEAPDYLAKYVGLDHTLQVDFVTSATISSKALKDAVTAAFAGYAAVSGADIDVSIDKEPTPMELIFPDSEYVEITVAGAEKAYKVPGKGVILMTVAEGYHGMMQVYTGIGADMKIAGVALGENTETPGIGTQVGEEAFTSTFVGRDDITTVMVITDATISSRAFKAGVNAALALIPDLGDIVAEAVKGA